MEVQKQEQALVQLHALLEDSRKGYKEAMNKAKDTELTDLLSTLSKERSIMEDEMANEARTFQHDVATSSGTVKGDLHRAWISIRDAMGGMSDATIASECERGESHLLGKYDHVLNSVELAPQTQSLLIRQRAEVGSNVMKLRAITDRTMLPTDPV